MPITVALVNDYEVVVRGLAEMLREYAEVEVVELVANREVDTPVDVALFDNFAADRGDAACVQQLLANPRVRKVVIYSWDVDGVPGRSVLSFGAHGYLSKRLPAHRLVEGLRDVSDGKTVINAKGAVRSPVGDWPGREEGLTPRESEVIALITQGLSNKDIAARTYLSPNSVKSYIRSAYRKMEVESRSQAVLWGIEHGFRPDRLRVPEQ